MRIQNNIAALNTSKNLAAAQKKSQSNLAKLSTGFAINKAADNASGLAVSEKMRSQIRGLKQASKNATDGINLTSQAEGYMNTANDILQRMRELAVQSANGSYDGDGSAATSILKGDDQDTNRAKINEEIQALTDELDRIATTANFNGMKLSTPNTETKFTFQVGANTSTKYASNGAISDRQGTNAETITVSIGGFDSKTLGVNAKTKLSAEDVKDAKAAAAKDAYDFLKNQDYAITALSGTMAKNKADLTDEDFATIKEKVDAVVAKFGDADMLITQETDGVASKVLSQSQKSDLIGLQSSLAQTATLAAGDVDGIDLSSQTSANASIDKIDAAISKITNYRAQLGAAQSRLSYTVDNIATSIENTTASESAIRDTDMVAEMMDFTKNNVLSQAATAMMAQANTQTQSVLQLLQ